MDRGCKAGLLLLAYSFRYEIRKVQALLLPFQLNMAVKVGLERSIINCIRNNTC
jgi:hypothetical protein